MHRPISINIRHRFSLNCFWVFFCFVLFTFFPPQKLQENDAGGDPQYIRNCRMNYRLENSNASGGNQHQYVSGKENQKNERFKYLLACPRRCCTHNRDEAAPCMYASHAQVWIPLRGVFHVHILQLHFFFLSYSRREMRESTQKKKPNITHDYIHEFYYYFEELYLCYYFIKWADAVGHYHFLEHSNNPCHLSLSVCNSHLRTCHGDRATVR